MNEEVVDYFYFISRSSDEGNVSPEKWIIFKNKEVLSWRESYDLDSSDTEVRQIFINGKIAYYKYDVIYSPVGLSNVYFSSERNHWRDIKSLSEYV